MKKRIMVIALWVIFSIFTVSISFSKPPVAPIPETQQVPNAQRIKVQKPKDEFWDLKVDRFTINGKSFSFGTDDFLREVPTVNITVGKPVAVKVYYKMKTIPVGNITEGDAQYWGSGIKFDNFVGITDKTRVPIKRFTKSLPKFTFGDIQNWFIKMQGCKSWTSYVTFQFTPIKEYVGSNGWLMLHFGLDSKGTINETNEDNNCNHAMNTLASFNVSPDFGPARKKIRIDRIRNKTNPRPTIKKLK